MMRIETLTLLRQCLHSVTLNVGAPDFQETATVVLAAYNDLEMAIREATSEPWPGYSTHPDKFEMDEIRGNNEVRNANPSIDKVGT
jgi:hypothetical protein